MKKFAEGGASTTTTKGVGGVSPKDRVYTPAEQAAWKAQETAKDAERQKEIQARKDAFAKMTPAQIKAKQDAFKAAHPNRGPLTAGTPMSMWAPKSAEQIAKKAERDKEEAAKQAARPAKQAAHEAYSAKMDQLEKDMAAKKAAAAAAAAANPKPVTPAPVTPVKPVTPAPVTPPPAPAPAPVTPAPVTPAPAPAPAPAPVTPAPVTPAPAPVTPAFNPTSPSPNAPGAFQAMKKGGKVKKATKKYASGGTVKVSSASRRGDGCAIRGKTRGRNI